MQDNFRDAWWGLTPPHVAKWNPPQLTTEIGCVATIGRYANTHSCGLSVVKIVPYTHIIVLQRSTIMPTDIPLTQKYSPIKDHMKPQVKKDQAIAAIYSQNTTAKKPPEILLSFYLKNIYLYEQLYC
jgi:hypothetical protein